MTEERCIHESYNDFEEYYFCDHYGDLDFEPCKKEDNCPFWKDKI